MMTVHEVSSLTGVSIRTLQYYDSIDLLKPAEYTESGYRLYDEESLERLQTILLFKELEFPLKDIKKIIDSSDFDKETAISQQIELLQLKKQHIENLLKLALDMQKNGMKGELDFAAFDKKKLDEYTAKAKEYWGGTDAYKEYEKKSLGRSADKNMAIAQNMMELFKEFGDMKHLSPDSDTVQRQVQRLQNFITENYYKCTNEILSGLGSAYGSGGEMTENIDKAGGPGTGAFAEKAIRIYCSK